MSYTPWPLSDEQHDILDHVRGFAHDTIRPSGRRVDEADTESPVDIFAAAARLGITDFMIPEEFGGGGFTDVFTQCLVQEQLCFGDPGIGNFVCSNGFFADPILALGTPEQKEEWLRPLTGADPKITALATTEPGSGSDSASIMTRADAVDGGYVLNGQKAWISNAGLADFYVVFAKTDSSRRSRGISAFLLPRETEGMEFGAPMKKMGQRAIVCREIFFSDAFVPTSGRLGEEGGRASTDSCAPSTSHGWCSVLRRSARLGRPSNMRVTMRGSARSSGRRSSITRPSRSAWRICPRGSMRRGCRCSMWRGCSTPAISLIDSG